MIKKLLMMALSITSLSACGHTPSQLLPPAEFGEFIETQPSLTLLDVRTPEEFSESHLPGAINIDMQTARFVDEVKASVAESSPIALYCRSGRRSAEAAASLAKAGFSTADLEGGILAWQKAELPVTDGTADFYTTPGGHTIRIQPLIHASLRISFEGREIEIDPVGTLGDRTTDYSQFPKADLILVTHEHHDHLDPAAIKALSGDSTIVIANRNSAEILGYGKVMANGDSLKTANGIGIEAVPAYNISPDRLQFHPKGRDNGYVLTLDGFRIYIAGDTENIPEMRDLKDIDVAFLPCNLPYTMTPVQLIEAAEAFKPKVVYPYHYGTTDLSPITPALARDGIYVRICPFDPGH